MTMLPLAFIQGHEWLVILVAILILFGGAKIPQLMRGIGKGVSEFQEGIKEGKRKISEGMNEATADTAESK
jgi:sec-independent protein translocase protein TatA